MLIFLCHCSEDKPAVRNLHGRLQQAGYTPWLDEVDLLPGQDWDREISDVLRRADVVLVCLSKHAASKRGYIQRELKRALDAAEELPEGTLFIVPAKLEPCDVPPRLSKWQWVALYQEGGFERLERSLRAQPGRIDGSLTAATEMPSPFVLMTAHMLTRDGMAIADAVKYWVDDGMNAARATELVAEADMYRRQK
jgi:hypothetical protein